MATRNRVVQLLSKTDYDFSALASAASVTNLPLLQNVDLASWGAGTLLVRVHDVTLQTGSYFRVDARIVAPTSEEPGTFFRERIVASVVAEAATASAPSLLRAGLAADTGEAISLFLTVVQAKPGALTFTLSIDLVLHERADTWTPAELGTKLRLWLDHRDLVAVSGAYSDWGDQSPTAAQDFSQGTASLRPATGTEINRSAAPAFDGAGDYLAGSTLSSFIAPAAYHVFVVLRTDSVTGTNATAYLNNGVIADTGLGWWGLYLKNSAGTLQVHGFHWDSALRDAIGTGLQLSTDTLIEWSYDGTTLRCQVGGGPIATATGNGNVGSLTNAVRIGTGATNSLYFDGAIASILVCNAYLSETDVQNVRGYLSSTYGVRA